MNSLFLVTGLMDTKEIEKKLIGVREKLKQWFETWFQEWVESEIDKSGWNDVQKYKDFWIQYSVFERDMDDDNEDEPYKFEKWYMNCTVPGTQNEGIHHIDTMEYHEASTELLFDSWKGNYDDCKLDYLLYHKDQSDFDRVYLMDLYPEQKEKHFHGHCYTRGGFTSWNWLQWNEKDEKFVSG
jgi:hypothetical protein